MGTEQVVGICASCNKPIYDNELIRRGDVPYIDSNGIKKYYPNQIMCNECYERIQKEERKRKEEMREKALKQERANRIKGYIGGGIAALIFLIIAIICMSQKETTAGLVYLFVALSSFTFIGSLFLNNNSLGKIWLKITLWGFETIREDIWEMDIDSLIFSFIVKTLLTILFFPIACLMIVVATGVALPVSLVTYPVAMVRSVRNTKNLKK